MKMIYNHKGYPKCIVSALKVMGQQQESLVKLREVAQDAEEIAEICKEELECTFGVAAWVNYQSTIYMCTQVEDMKQAAFILRELGKRGYHQTAKIEEDPANNKREYFLGKIRIEIGLKGSVCRYVKVGEETVVQDIFELQCDGEEPTD